MPKPEPRIKFTQKEMLMLKRAMAEHQKGEIANAAIWADGRLRSAKLSAHQPKFGVSFDVLNGSRGRVIIPFERIWGYVETAMSMKLGIEVTVNKSGVIRARLLAEGER